MRIVTKFSDYYDGCNYDHSVQSGIYERFTKEIPIQWFSLHNCVEGETRKCYLQSVLVGFCGKLYPCIKYTNTVQNKDGFTSKTTTEYIYNFKDFDDLRKELSKVKQCWRWGTGRDRYYYDKRIFIAWGGKDEAKWWFDMDFEKIFNDRRQKDRPNPKDFFLEHRVPYFVIEPHNFKDYDRHSMAVVLNPCLKDYMFYRILDPYTCFQEIEMFMNNQIVRPDDPFIEPVSDKIKAESHGFDKFSFRKDKSKKKGK